MAWAPQVASTVIDNGLTTLKTNASRIYICSTQLDTETAPDFTMVSSTYDLGWKDLGAGNVIPGAIANGTNGRKVTTATITDGTVNDTGTAQFWGITSTNTLYAVGDLSATQAVTSGNTFSLGAFDITIKSQ